MGDPFDKKSRHQSARSAFSGDRPLNLALWRLASVLIEIAQSESGESETEAPPSGPPRASALPKVESGG